MDAPAVVPLAAFQKDPKSKEAIEACTLLANSLLETGMVLLRDERVTKEQNDSFLDLMEDYFGQPNDVKMQDVRKEVHYQVGATPAFVEVPICKADETCQMAINAMEEDAKPSEILGADPKWRFFWRIGERPKEGGFEDLNAQPVVPAAFPHWKETMDGWGGLMLDAVTTCAKMAAVGFGMEENAISDMMEEGPHMLAPTGSDMSSTSQAGIDNRVRKGGPLAGYHNDLNLLTIHGKSRYPGLFAWTKNGKKMKVAVPDGCLLVQAGMQMERLTGGAVQAGMHEVVVLPETVAAADRQEAKGRPAWRISSTLFSHIASKQVLRPLGKFATKEAQEAYPDITAGAQVLDILQKISLADPSGAEKSQKIKAAGGHAVDPNKSFSGSVERASMFNKMFEKLVLCSCFAEK
jgi:isopenicillin N synthase-like dioxygenase